MHKNRLSQNKKNKLKQSKVSKAKAMSKDQINKLKRRK